VHCCGGIAADEVRTGGQGDTTPAGHDPPAHRCRSYWPSIDWRGTGVAHAVRRSNDRCPRVTILQCPSKFLYEHDERCVRHKRSRPEPLVQLGLSHDARRFVCQEGEEIKRLGREMNLNVVSRELPPVWCLGIL
jgi:hypothetical protein